MPPRFRHSPRAARLAIALCLCILGLVPAAHAEDVEDIVTFAPNEYAAEQTATHDHTYTCPVCRSAVFAVTSEMVSVLGGRYEFQGVEQRYCQVCKVTTLSVPATRQTRNLIWKLRTFIPATRDKIVQTRSSFQVALKSNNDIPFISGILAMEQRDGTLFLEVE